jgi:protein-S-isoprenylcysteine O-methyltransferase Ste14
MNLLQPWNVVFLVGFIVYVWIRGVFVQRTKSEAKRISRFDRLEKILLAAMFPPTMLLPLLYLFTPLLSFADYRLPAAVPWLGAATMVASLWLFWRSHTDLGQNWSVSLELREGHQLVTRGVYRWIRHPMYASIWLWGLAQGMLLQNWLAGWSVIPVFAAMYFLRTPREEQLMCESFGSEYIRIMTAAEPSQAEEPAPAPISSEESSI